MKVTLLDTKTGRLHTECGGGVFWWTEGNGSCDCNRAGFMSRGDEDLAYEQQTALSLPDNTCLGSLRFLVVDVSGDLEGRGTREEIIDLCNEGYPEELLKEHLHREDHS